MEEIELKSGYCLEIKLTLAQDAKPKLVQSSNSFVS